jgi:hypothetical protein
MKSRVIGLCLLIVFGGHSLKTRATHAADQCTAGLAGDPSSSQSAALVSQAKCSQDDDCTTNVCVIALGADTSRCVTSIRLSATDRLRKDLQ